ncbi:MAG: MFS transporter [Candidatus Rokubacteria bacterium]|nr:MFS transporter [Candidatus Rokubacteria bacterium]
MRFPSGFRALNHAEFRLFFAAQLVAQTGSWMHSVAQSWLVLQLTNSPLKLGFIATLSFGPILLFSLLSGVVADRVPHRTLLLATQTAFAGQALALGLLVWSGQAVYWHVGALALLGGFVSALDGPVRQVFVADLVARDDVVNAVALNSAAFNGARIIGPAVGGLIIGRFGVVPAFLVNCAGFLVVIAALLALAARQAPPRRRAGVLAQIVEGVRYTVRTPPLGTILLVLAVVSWCVFNFSVYVPLLARDVLHLGAEGFGFLMAALGVGAVIGALTVGTRAREPGVGAMLALAAVACTMLVGLASIRSVPPVVALLLVTGFTGIAVTAGCNTALQLRSADSLRGRVMSVYTLIGSGMFPLSAFTVGAIAQAWGVSVALAIQGIAGLTALAAIAARRRAVGVR